MKKTQATELILQVNKDYTPTKLKDFLNKKFGSKKSGKLFTYQDIYQYVLRGHIPYEYGGHPLTQIDDSGTGIKLLRIGEK